MQIVTIGENCTSAKCLLHSWQLLEVWPASYSAYFFKHLIHETTSENATVQTSTTLWWLFRRSFRRFGEFLNSEYYVFSIWKHVMMLKGVEIWSWRHIQLGTGTVFSTQFWVAGNKKTRPGNKGDLLQKWNFLMLKKKNNCSLLRFHFKMSDLFSPIVIIFKPAIIG
jgi:hypothetical protein